MSVLSVASIHTRRKITNDTTLLGAEETRVTTEEALVGYVRVYEVLHRRTKYENEL